MQNRPTRSASYTLGLLLVIYVVNHVDRQVMYILAEAVKEDLALSDGQLGFLMGGGFAIFYAFAGLPIARLADRGNRTTLISLALLIWSAMTVASGMATNFVQLLLARVGVGVGEAGCTPPAHSILSDTYPPERRSFALSVYQLGVPFGILFGFSAGGILTDELGWRTAFFVVGVPGVVLALIARLTLAEPERGRFDAGTSTEVEPVGPTLAYIFRLPSMRHVLIGSSLQTLFLAGAGAFHASFLQRVHGLTVTEVGLQLGLVAGLTGAVAVYGAGWLSERLERRDLRWTWWIPAIGALASLPFSYVAYTTGSAPFAVVMIACATLLNHTYSALTHAIMQSLVRPRMRAVTSALALFAMNLVGFGLGPVLVGLLSDRFGGGAEIRWALVSLIVFVAWAAVHYLLGARSYVRDLEAKNA